MKSFLMFIFGAVVGAAGAAFVTKYICDAKAEAKIADATADARNFYKEKYEGDAKKIDAKVDQKVLSALTEVYKSDDSDRIFGKAYDVRDTVDYRTIISDPNRNKPYLTLVDPDDLEAFDNYEQYSLDYYQDGNLVDESGNLVDNPIEIAGDFLDDLSLENPEIYVSNDVTKTVYDICYVAASFDQPGGEND